MKTVNKIKQTLNLIVSTTVQYIDYICLFFVKDFTEIQNRNDTIANQVFKM